MSNVDLLHVSHSRGNLSLLPECVWVLSISFEVRLLWRVLTERFTHSLRSVQCVSMSAFFISMGKQQCWAYYQKEARSSEKTVSAFFLSFSTLPHFFPFPPSPVYKAFVHKLQRITRHTPFKSTEPYSSSVPSLCLKGNIWARAFEILQRKESGGRKTKKGGRKRRGGWDWVIAAAHREGERVREQSSWPAASLCHHTAFVQRVDLERTFQRGGEKSGRWQKNTEKQVWENGRARGEGAK